MSSSSLAVQCLLIRGPFTINLVMVTHYLRRAKKPAVVMEALVLHWMTTTTTTHTEVVWIPFQRVTDGWRRWWASMNGWIVRPPSSYNFFFFLSVFVVAFALEFVSIPIIVLFSNAIVCYRRHQSRCCKRLDIHNFSIFCTKVRDQFEKEKIKTFAFPFEINWRWRCSWNPKLMMVVLLLPVKDALVDSKMCPSRRRGGGSGGREQLALMMISLAYLWIDDRYSTSFQILLARVAIGMGRKVINHHTHRGRRERKRLKQLIYCVAMAQQQQRQ